MDTGNIMENQLQDMHDGYEHNQKRDRDVAREIADKYQDFFNMMNQEHGLILTISEMDEIIHEALKVQENKKKLKL